MKRKLYTANGIAVELGLDRRAVALALGDIEPDGKIGGRDAYTLRTYFQAMASNRKPAHALNGDGATNDVSHGSYANERARWTAEKGRIAEMQRRKLEGELLPAAEVEATWAAVAALIRTRLLALSATAHGALAFLGLEGW